MEKVGITIIGAGVVGLAIVHELAKSGRKDILVVEKNTRYGLETSSRNSEVIHSGIYYPKDSLKAKLCVQGRIKLYELCEKHKIPFRKSGKLIVSLDETEFEYLHKLKENGQQNGVEGLEIMSKNMLNQLEPNVSGYGALFSPETGIIDSEKLMHYFYHTSKEAGAIIVFDSKVIDIDRINSGYAVTIEKDNYKFETEILINSAGLFADGIAGYAGLNIDKLGYRIKYCKGEYFKINRNINIEHLIYPVPEKVSLGTHLVIDMAGGKKLGPNSIYVDSISYDVDESHKTDFYEKAVRYIPDITLDDLSPDTSGIRAKLQDEKDDFRDFIIKDETENGLAGFINIIGIESPGLTASPAIAEYVSRMVRI